MKNFIATLLLCFLFLNANACDVCGGGVSNLNPYLFPHQSKSYIGAAYLHSHYQLHQDGQVTNQYNNAIVFSGQYTIKNKLQLMALVPFQANTIATETTSVNTQGVGDVTLLANYILLQKAATETAHAITVGGGLKLPTGEYNMVKTDKLTDQNFQLGSGSLDYLLNASYRFTYRNFVVNTLGAYKFTTSNEDGYRYGDMITTGATLVYLIKRNNFSLAPYMQALHETHYRDAAHHILQNHSGGNVLYTGGGLDVSAQKFTVGLNYQVAAKQNLIHGDLQAKPRLSARVSFTL